MLDLHFTINYYTRPHESLFLNLTEKDAEGDTLATAYPMSSADGKDWFVDVVLKDGVMAFDYFYSLYEDGEEVRVEWSRSKRSFDCAKWPEQAAVLFKDAWQDVPPQAYLWSSAFTQCWRSRPLKDIRLPDFNGVVEYRVSVPEVEDGEEVALAGNIPELGQWNPALAPVLNEFARNEWNLRLPRSLFNLYRDIQCKVIIRDVLTKKVRLWETGENRRLFCNDTETLVVCNLKEPVFEMAAHPRFAGVVIPVFSLRSEHSWGVGDFGDLKRLVDWAVATGMSAIQILPVNDTTLTHTWEDSYPYNCISIYALHPQYLDLSQMGRIHDHKLMKAFEQRKESLERLSSIDYEAVNQLKEDYTRELYRQDGAAVLKSKEFDAFFRQNKTWLIPYAAFCFLRDKSGTADFTKWPEYSRYHAADIRRLSRPDSPDYPDIAYYYYVQYHLDRQLSEACDYARRHGVVLKGDIPIGISRESVETWTEPYYFNLDRQTGAPPDAFSTKGQNWGFPTYNWSSMLADKCKWWVNRFRHMSRYFDAYRIDHILGFFRIWSIPLSSVYGLLGQFSPSLPLSVSEIEGYGLHFKEEFTTPYADDAVLSQLFGCDAPKVAGQFLEATGDGRYRFKEKYGSQRKIEDFFRNNQDGFKDGDAVKEKLYALLSDVLFIEDTSKKGHFHPRIGVQGDFVYHVLLDEMEKTAFNHLYDDYYYHRHNDFWYRSASRKLPRLVQSTDMLVCGEDLGMIPGCVPWLMKDLRILSLEIESMPKGYGEFADVLQNPYLSVCTIATHDMPTFREWWEEDKGRTARYCHEILHREGDVPVSASAFVCREVVERHLSSPSMLTLLSLQDWLSIDAGLRNPDVHSERINVPAESRHYWRYRMHLTIETLMKSSSFTERVKNMIRDAGRFQGEPSLRN